MNKICNECRVIVDEACCEFDLGGGKHPTTTYELSDHMVRIVAGEGDTLCFECDRAVDDNRNGLVPHLIQFPNCVCRYNYVCDSCRVISNMPLNNVADLLN